MELLFSPNNYDKYFGCWCRREPLRHNLVLEKLFPDVSLDKKREKLFVSIGNTLFRYALALAHDHFNSFPGKLPNDRFFMLRPISQKKANIIPVQCLI